MFPSSETNMKSLYTLETYMTLLSTSAVHQLFIFRFESTTARSTTASHTIELSAENKRFWTQNHLQNMKMYYREFLNYQEQFISHKNYISQRRPGLPMRKLQYTTIKRLPKFMVRCYRNTVVTEVRVTVPLYTATTRAACKFAFSNRSLGYFRRKKRRETGEGLLRTRISSFTFDNGRRS